MVISEIFFRFSPSKKEEESINSHLLDGHAAKERKKLNEPKLQSALDQEILNYTDIRNAGTRIVKRRKLG